MNNSSANLEPAILQRMLQRLQLLYGDAAQSCLCRIADLLGKYRHDLPVGSRTGWDQRDVVLISYGDQVRQDNRMPLVTLREFLLAHRLEKLIRTVHLLPFNPYSSDDGFSVIDYRMVDSELGDWADLAALGQSFELMFDLVLNHVSSHSAWFQNYLAGQEPHDKYFIEESPATDLSNVTRPRSSPLLTEFETANGKRHLWTTFSADQLDLNFANPDVLIEMLDVFLFYVQQGARIIRLDAIAYLWKRVGSSCVHLPETHQFVKLLRDVIGAVAPHVILLTETNVPHAQNVSYFGDGDEAQLVYQFSLPPLLLYTMLSGNAQPLSNWLQQLQQTPRGTTFFNFTASHDGVGVRPLEGLIAKQQFEWLVDQLQLRGALVSTRKQSDGTNAPYELNVSYFSAMADPHALDAGNQIRRFLASQAIMLALRGMPAIYFHSLFATENDRQAARSSGLARRINRRKFKLSELNQTLHDPDSIPAQVFARYRQMLSVRCQQPAFHPDAEQINLPIDKSWLIAFLRTSLDRKQKILSLANVSDQHQRLDLIELCDVRFGHDLLSGTLVPSNQQITLEPLNVVWLEAI